MQQLAITGMQQERMRVPGFIREGQALDRQGHEALVTIIRGGKSINGYYYAEAALQQIAQMIEGARAYVDHGRSEADQQTRSVRDMVGFYQDARYVPPGDGQAHGRVDATLHILEAASWLWSMLCEAVALGKPNLIGLSIDIFGAWEQADSARNVTRIVSLNSCDVVTRPSAGGAIKRVLHSDALAPVDQDNPPSSEPPQSTPSSQSLLQGESSFMDIQETQLPQTPTASPPETPRPASQATTPASHISEAQQAVINAALADIQRERCALLLERRLLETQLPQAAQQQVRAQFTGRIFEETELESGLGAMRTLLTELHTAGLIKGNGYEKPQAGQMISEAEKIQAAFDRMFDLEIDTARLGNIRGFSSIREAYARVTGDGAVAGFSDRTTLGAIQISEHAPVVRITEADTTTASFSYLLGTSMNKRLLRDYQAWPAEWQKFCTIAPIKDFKQQVRVRLGAFGSLSTVAEDTAYSTISLSDTAATYVPSKRGNLVTVSRETIVNDDLFAIKQIPTKLAVAAAYTLAEFVYSFLSANPTIYDGNALFTSGAPHSNLGSSALSTAAMQTGVTAMREQTNFAGKRLGLRPTFLIVPPELEFTAMVVTKSAGVPGSNNNDINPMLGYVTPIVSPQLSNTSQWFFASDPKVVDTIEIGFVGGQVNPALFIQDQPLFGLNFTQDVISYKVRQEYGGAVMDWRGLYRGI
ncbi:MAG TPA: Mu-like prophage major head subunit gpT family protein [Ktedonobacteraceae bacterium]|nr:Mu-like prophage major head subunit gpT family protein [Ktedonobacteraceae bacterium]